MVHRGEQSSGWPTTSGCRVGRRSAGGLPNPPLPASHGLYILSKLCASDWPFRSTSLTKPEALSYSETRGRQDPPDPSAPPHRTQARERSRSLRAPAPGRPAQRPRTRGRQEGVHRMALKTPEEFVQSLADLHLQIYLFGEKIDDYVNHPAHPPQHQLHRHDLRARGAAGVRGPHAGHEPPHRQEGQPLHPHPPVHRGPLQEGQDAAPAGPEDRLLLPALRGHGRHQRAVLGHLRDRPGQGHGLPRALQEVRAVPAGQRPRRRRRHDRPQGRPLRCRRTSSPTPTCTCTSSRGATTASSSAAPRRTRRAPATRTRSSSCPRSPCARATRTSPSASAARPTPRASTTSTAARAATRASSRRATWTSATCASAARRP